MADPRPEENVSHSPGPWEMAGPVGHGIWIQSESEPNIAAVHGAYTGRGLANARLIAAAPKMLQALRAAERDLATFEREMSGIAPEAKSKALPMLREALK